MAVLDNIDKEFRVLVGTIGGTKKKPTVEGLEFGNEEQCIAITTISGLETPPIRNNSGDWSGRDGGYMSSQLYSARTITINGFYWDDKFACNIKSMERKNIPYSVRERLANTLMIRKKYPLFFKFIDGRILYTEGFMIDFKMDYELVSTGQYQVTFYCPNYALSEATTYGDITSIWHRAELHKEIFGGHLVPETLPVLFEEGRHPTTVEYTGMIPSYPLITYKGPATNPIFMNTAVNKYIRIGTDANPWSMVEGQTLTIDMSNRQVLLNGKSVSMYIDPQSEWWYLTPGRNKIYLITDEPTDTQNAEIRWTNDYQGA